jgi:hypothetical protein
MRLVRALAVMLFVLTAWGCSSGSSSASLQPLPPGRIPLEAGGQAPK